ncbi:hypothetical protein MMSR116_06250 [Methylobacterium mesophilicum SR1.6/6]|uniref:Uncharacterized protein n=1 Tax=Methylobacterium mesophilicum SR1.6/6 TaxID=908290 RepID=A0A6B9FG58_9HYPH|nr:hypothetical protein [Methylobacterium mesophilicum]QGY01547.1 hypothetical protein MMSR116_06250 [Methylobacterium mesophilicum SR1.6/6]
MLWLTELKAVTDATTLLHAATESVLQPAIEPRLEGQIGADRLVHDAEHVLRGNGYRERALPALASIEAAFEGRRTCDPKYADLQVPLATSATVATLRLLRG